MKFSRKLVSRVLISIQSQIFLCPSMTCFSSFENTEKNGNRNSNRNKVFVI